MREADWNECMESGAAIRRSPDVGRARSLLEVAKERLLFAKSAFRGNCNFVFEACYSSLLEMLHALVLLDGYKVLNHVCIGFYLRDVMKREDLFRIFDDLRYKRNSMIYYGRKMEPGTCRKAIDDCMSIIREMEKEISEKLPR